MACLICFKAISARPPRLVPPEQVRNLILTTCKLLKVNCGDDLLVTGTSLNEAMCCLKCHDSLRNIQLTYNLLLETQGHLQDCLNQVKDLGKRTLTSTSEETSRKPFGSGLFSQFSSESCKRTDISCVDSKENGETQRQRKRRKIKVVAREDEGMSDWEEMISLDNNSEAVENPLETLLASCNPEIDGPHNMGSNENFVELKIEGNDHDDYFIDQDYREDAFEQDLPSETNDEENPPILDTNEGKVELDNANYSPILQPLPVATASTSKTTSYKPGQRREWICTHDQCGRLFHPRSAWVDHVKLTHPGADVPEKVVLTTDLSGKGKPRARGPMYDLPFLIINENLFLFKQSTFVEYNYTHLICKAYNCDFKVPFEYFPSFEAMRDHLEENHRGLPFRRKARYLCFLCNPSGLLLPGNNFPKHIRTVHPEFNSGTSKVKGICECCLKPCAYQTTTVHQFKHKNAEEVEVARKLGLGKARALALKKSERDALEKNGDLFKCTEKGCSFATTDAAYLKVHRRKRHIPKESQPGTGVCQECGALVPEGKARMIRHMKQFHHKTDAVEHVLHCPECNKKFLLHDRHRLQLHMKLHRGERPFMCDECGKSFVANGQLLAHRRDVHELGDWKCTLCPDKEYTSKVGLRSHWCRVHKGEPFPMSTVHMEKRRVVETETRFYQEKEDYKKAKEMVPERKWPCDECDVVCCSKHVLERHKKRIHQGIDVHARWKKKRSLP